MTKPLRLYLFEDSLLPTTASSSSRANVLLPASNLDNHRPGVMMELGESFQIRQGGAGQNNHLFLKYPSAGAQFQLILTGGGYDGNSLAAHLQSWFQGVDAGFSVSYSTTTRKWTISHSSTNFDLLWNTGGPVQHTLADTLGFSDTADDTGASSYESDDEVFVKDYQWITWWIQPSAKAIMPALSCAMFYSTNITDDAARFHFSGHTADLGGDPMAWASSAAYRGVARPATQSEFNDLYLWCPDDDGSPNSLRWWQLGIYRGDEDQATMPALRIGVGAMWSAAWFDGGTWERNYHTPWEWALVGGNVANFAPDGGGMERGQSRGYAQAVLPFTEWDEDTYREFWRFKHQHDRKPVLLLADADDLGTTTASAGGLSTDLAPEKALYCVLDGDWTNQAGGPEDHRTFTITARGIPMHPKGS